MKKLEKKMPVLVQVNISGEASKYGVKPDDMIALCRKVEELPGTQLQGLMTIGTFSHDPEKARKDFRSLRKMRDKALESGITESAFRYLSMGMTGDFEIAIEEGANMIRVGTAIFGRRA